MFEYLYMELEHQVTNLKLAKKLRDLGVKQDSLFYWSEVDESFDTLDHETVGGVVWKIFPKECLEDWMPRSYSAFTVAELGEILIRNSGGNFRLFTDAYGYFVCGWDKKIDFSEQTEADARAKMLIYLLEMI